MGSQEDDEYWNTRYAEALCHEHGEDPMVWDAILGEWICMDCEDEDEVNRIYNYG